MIHLRQATLRFAVLVAALALPLGAQPDPAQIMRQAIAFEQANDKKAQEYTYEERREERKLDKDGAIRSTETETFDITFLGGSLYRRLIARDDQPLSVGETEKEERKLDKQLAKIADENSRQREKRLKKEAEEREEERRFIDEIFHAYDFRLIGEEAVAGVDTWIIDAEPRPDFKPSFSKAKFLAKLQGRAWIAKESHAWVRSEVETIDSISFGLFLFRLKEGAVLEFSQTPMEDGVWLIDRFRLFVDGRIGLLRGIRREIVTTYGKYRKFSSDSKIIDGDPVE